MSEAIFCYRLISLWQHLTNLKVCIITVTDIFFTRCSKRSIHSHI